MDSRKEGDGRAGDGGLGKTLLMLQLQTSCAIGGLWLGLPVKQCISVGFYTEDDEEDIRIQQEAINRAYGIGLPDLDDCHWFPRQREENEIVVFDRRGKAILTKFYTQVREATLDNFAKLLVLDVAVDLFGGDEIIRRQVRAFSRPLNALAREMQGTVVFTSHPSQAGIRSGGGHSGNTDWSNGVRSRLYLGEPDRKEGDPIDFDARILSRKKANFARAGEKIDLRWKEGVLERDAVKRSYTDCRRLRASAVRP
jgi:RecA-family ATPase